MMIRKNIVCVGVVAVLLVAGSMSSSKNIAADWIFKIENMTSFAMSPNGKYVIVACEEGPLCEKGQFYVFDRYGNTVTHNCINSEITVVDIADNGAFFIGTRTGYYFSSTSGKVQQKMNMESIFKSVSMSENGETVIAGTDKEILIFDRNGIIIDEEVVNRPVKFTGVDSSGRRAVAGTEDSIFVYEKSSKKWEEKLVKVGGIGDLAISDDGSTIICGMPTQNIWILDSRLNIMKSFMVKGSVYSVAVTANGKFFVCGTKQGDVYYFNSAGDKIWPKNLEKAIEDVFVSSDGSFVAALSENINLFDSLGKELQELKTSRGIERMQFSRSGEILSYISNGELVFLETYQLNRVPTYEYVIPSRKDIPLDDQFTCDPLFNETLRSVIVADINGDGQNEIVCSFAKEVAVLTSEGRILWKQSFEFSPGIVVMDLTRDFIPEVIVTSHDNRMGIQVFNERGEKIADREFYSRWYGEPPSLEYTIGIRPVWSGDIDNDNLLEVICQVNAGYTRDPRGFFVFEYPTFKEEWYYPVAPTLSTIHIVDINGDGQAEIIAGSHAVCNGREVGSTDDCHAYVYAVTLEGERLWRKQIGPQGFSRIDIAIADLDGDGTQEIIGGGWSYKDNWGTLFALDSKGDYILGKKKEFGYSVFLEAVSDLDNDGKMEILTSSFPSTLALYDDRFGVIRRMQNVRIKLSYDSLVAINDYDADGKKEIILTSEDPELLVLNIDLEEEWSEVFPGYEEYLKTVVANFGKCKNHLLVLSDKLYACTYAQSPDWPCVPWIIVEQQKKVEAEESLEAGNRCLEKEDCGCAKSEFTKAKSAYEQIKDQDGIDLAEGRINTAETCLSAQESLEKAKEFFNKENRSMAEKHLSEAEEAYEIIGNQERLEEIRQYFEQIMKIKSAEGYFDGGRSQIRDGQIEDGVVSLEESRKRYEEYGWSYHVQLVENEISKVSTISLVYDKIATYSSIASVIIGVVSIIITYWTARKKKSFVYRKISEILLPKQDIFHVIGRKDVENLYLLRMKFINNGKENILKQDFVKPIAVKFNPQARVYRVSESDRNPENMHIDFDYQVGGNIVEIRKNFVGPEEWFVADFYIENYEECNIEARIADIKKLEVYEPHKFLDILSRYFFFCGVAVLMPVIVLEILKYPDVLHFKVQLLLPFVVLILLRWIFKKTDFFSVKYDP